MGCDSMWSGRNLLKFQRHLLPSAAVLFTFDIFTVYKSADKQQEGCTYFFALNRNKFYNFQDLGTPNEKIWPGYSKLPAVQKMAFTEYPVNQLRSRFGTMITDVGMDLMNRYKSAVFKLTSGQL